MSSFVGMKPFFSSGPILRKMFLSDKNQLVKLKRDSSNVRLGTLFKVFRALGVSVKIQFEAPPMPPPKIAKLAAFALLFFFTYTDTSLAVIAGLVCF